MANPAKTLANILAIIDRDVKRIKVSARNAQLAASDALTLARYATTLDNISESKDRETSKAKKELEKLDTDALVAEYQKTKKTKKE